MIINTEKSGIIFWKDKNIKRREVEKERISGIPIVTKYKYLGIIFNAKMDFSEHLDYIKTKIAGSIKMINIMLW